jgi:DNA invertase Pin-like site-specific DNA recombinase
MLDDFKKHGVKFRSLAEAIDTETPAGRECERSLVVERTRTERPRKAEA